MGKGSDNQQLKNYCWNEVKQHDKKTDLWIVINGYVYDITNFQKKHPGGSNVMRHYSAQDASEAFTAFHKDMEKVGKYMNVYRIGKVTDEYKQADSAKLPKNEEMKNDMEKLRKFAIETDLFKPNYLFFTFHMLQILFCYFYGYYIIYKYGANLFACSIALLLHTIAQTQAGWSQHDYGHLSVFGKTKINHWAHLFMMGFIKGGTADWWNHLHNQHHAKPNVINKDPDVRVDPILVLGAVHPKKVAERDVKEKNNRAKSLFAYNHQHKYFWVVAATLFPLYFQYMNFTYVYKRRLYSNMIFMFWMYVLYFYVTVPALGWYTMLYYFLMRALDSYWFTWVSQSNHVVMDVHEDVNDDDTWLSLQLKATCNIETSWFNDWFTGHLNMQIEHHLFPTMPRHNLHKIQPLVRKLCEKHNIKYIVKPLGCAFKDILFSLEKSGKLWEEAYDEISRAM